MQKHSQQNKADRYTDRSSATRHCLTYPGSQLGSYKVASADQFAYKCVHSVSMYEGHCIERDSQQDREAFSRYFRVYNTLAIITRYQGPGRQRDAQSGHPHPHGRRLAHCGQHGSGLGGGSALIRRVYRCDPHCLNKSLFFPQLRLSGTAGSGATIRLYLEAYESRPTK